jgi:hypothetical protein
VLAHFLAGRCPARGLSNLRGPSVLRVARVMAGRYGLSSLSKEASRYSADSGFIPRQRRPKAASPLASCVPSRSRKLSTLSALLELRCDRTRDLSSGQSWRALPRRIYTGGPAVNRAQTLSTRRSRFRTTDYCGKGAARQFQSSQGSCIARRSVRGIWSGERANSDTSLRLSGGVQQAPQRRMRWLFTDVLPTALESLGT